MWVSSGSGRRADWPMSLLGQKQTSSLLPRMSASIHPDTVAKIENRSTLKISQRPMFRRLYRCNACQARYERPWSFLCKTMWSLTSPRAERISGPEKFRSSSRKDFFNNIRQKPTFPIGRFLLFRHSWVDQRLILDFLYGELVYTGHRMKLLQWRHRSGR
jgi:hypothetical protein